MRLPLMLLLETSTEVCSVAISKGNEILAFSETTEPNAHTSLITILIRDCLKEANLDINQMEAVAVSDGPGSYTSLRVGVATAKGICYTLNLPLIALDSLQILAAGLATDFSDEEEIIFPMIDARRMEVYGALFNKKLDKIMETKAIILDNSTLMNMQGKKIFHVCGSGAFKFVENFPNDKVRLHHLSTSATYMAPLANSAFNTGDFADLAYYSPNYFKAPNITKSLRNII